MAYNCTATLPCYSQTTGEFTHEVGPFGGYSSVDTEGNTYCDISSNPAVSGGTACGGVIAPYTGGGRPRKGGKSSASSGSTVVGTATNWLTPII